MFVQFLLRITVPHASHVIGVHQRMHVQKLALRMTCNRWSGSFTPMGSFLRVEVSLPVSCSYQLIALQSGSVASRLCYSWLEIIGLPLAVAKQKARARGTRSACYPSLFQSAAAKNVSCWMGNRWHLRPNGAGIALATRLRSARHHRPSYEFPLICARHIELSLITLLSPAW